MRHELSIEELNKRIALNEQRFLTDDYYCYPGVFTPEFPEWPGDKEGRTLLSLVCHYVMTGHKNPCMDLIVRDLPERTNNTFVVGEVIDGKYNEQQYSGNSWLLRGLCEYTRVFNCEATLNAVKANVERLYLPLINAINDYPVTRETKNGGVAGHVSDTTDKWKLSSDVGCAFMCVDGLSDAYVLTGDERILNLLEVMCRKLLSIDIVSAQFQTHCSLTAGRGMMRLYNQTKNMFFLDGAKKIMDLYVNHGGMTLTYQNYNWWGRPDTWTEPCAIVDSLMLAILLYKATNDESYRKLATRIYHNGFATIQRPNGGAGTDTIVANDSLAKKALYLDTDEARFCCSMRLTEGLRCAFENRELLYYETNGNPEKDEYGRYMDGDILYAEVSGIPKEKTSKPMIEKDGHTLCPLVKVYTLTWDETREIRQEIIFS